MFKGSLNILANEDEICHIVEKLKLVYQNSLIQKQKCIKRHTKRIKEKISKIKSKC